MNLNYSQYLGVLLSPKSHPRQRERMMKKLKNAIKYGTNKAPIDTRLHLFKLQLDLDNDNRLVIKLNGQELAVQSYKEFKDFFKKFEERIEEERNKVKQMLFELKVTDLIDVKAFPQIFIDYLSEYKLSSVYVMFHKKNIYNIKVNEVRLSFHKGNLFLNFHFYFMNPFWDREAYWCDKADDVIKDYVEYINTTTKDKIYIANVRRDTKAGLEYGFQNIDIEEDDEFINNIKTTKRIKRIPPEQQDKYIIPMGFLKNIMLVKFSHQTEKSAWFKPIEFPEYIFDLAQHSNLNIDLKNYSFSII
ncbi:MAG: hypothetical protein GXZ18_02565 [Synergistaceae bacterium]|nr:hypothetical protein [Synergistaceae bacterium]